jgi:hypothetical protein
MIVIRESGVKALISLYLRKGAEALRQEFVSFAIPAINQNEKANHYVPYISALRSVINDKRANALSFSSSGKDVSTASSQISSAPGYNLSSSSVTLMPSSSSSKTTVGGSMQQQVGIAMGH